MALKSSREGLRKELVDYLGNVIIDDNLRQSIINSIDNVFVNEADILSLEEIQATTDLTGKVASASALKDVERRLVSISLVYDNNSFPIGSNPPPFDSRQNAFVVRNVNSGAIYVVWYDDSILGFKKVLTLLGNEPSNGDIIFIQYIA